MQRFVILVTLHLNITTVNNLQDFKCFAVYRLYQDVRYLQNVISVCCTRLSVTVFTSFRQVPISLRRFSRKSQMPKSIMLQFAYAKVTKIGGGIHVRSLAKFDH